VIAVFAVLTFGYFALAKGTDPDALWKIVHDRCVPHQAAGTGPAPCAEVNSQAGYAVLKDKVGRTQYLLIPTSRVTGIEDPALLERDAPDYWQDAWAARHYVERELGGAPQRRGVIALSVNSEYGRSQDQLHIHIDCTKPEVDAWLRAHGGELTDAWRPLGQPFSGHVYQARRLMGEDLPEDPFALLAMNFPDKATMAKETLVVVPETFADGPGFVLLADSADKFTGDRASGEELQDHSCAIAR
jgi:CDP-diacylglycerol pyrophosphatase